MPTAAASIEASERETLVAVPLRMVKRDEEECGQGVSGGYNPCLR